MAIREVFFSEYCKTCKHYDKSEAEDPCFDCLDYGWNNDSHKPLYYEEGVEKDAVRRKEKTANR